MEGAIARSRVMLSAFVDMYQSPSSMAPYTMVYDNDSITCGGLPLYLAPEIRHVKPGAGVIIDYTHNDTYALGRCMYMMMCSNYDGTTSDDILHGVPSLPYSPALRNVVAALLANDTSLRMSVTQAKQSLRIIPRPPRALPPTSGDDNDECIIM